MGAATEWEVDVSVLQRETRTVYAVTSDEAREQAAKLPGVFDVIAVRRWSERDESSA